MRDDVQDKDRLPVLQELVNDYITQKQSVLLQVKKGQMSREDFMEEVMIDEEDIRQHRTING